MSGNAGKRQPMTIKEQADLIDYLTSRCVMRDGSIAAETYLTLNRDEVKDLEALALRLHRMSPVENEIRRLVTGR